MNSLDESSIITRIEPEEMNRNNTNCVVTYENHLHSTLYRLLHTQVGGIGDPRVLYFEDALTYIGAEDGSGPFIVE